VKLGKTEKEAIPGRHQIPQDPRETDRPDPPVTGSQGVIEMVVDPGQPQQRSLLPEEQDHNCDRRLNGGLGRNSSGHPHQGMVDGIPQTVTHKLSRDVGCRTDITTYPGFFTRQTHIAPHGQHDRQSLSQEAGGKGVLQPEQIHGNSLAKTKQTQCNTISEAYFWVPERVD